MKKYNIFNYIRYKEDLKVSIPEDRNFQDYTREELIKKFLPLVEAMARKFSTSDQASGILSILDLLQIGSEGLTKAVDKLDWDRMKDEEGKWRPQHEIEQTLKSFFSKRIKGNIRRRIDMHRGTMRLPEHKLNEMRNTKDKKMVAMFFNSIFLSIDAQVNNEDVFNQIPDKSEPYNITLMNIYLKSLMTKHLSITEYEVLRLSYGLDCDKHSAKEIAQELKIEGTGNYVRISELKKQAVQRLIDNVDHSQVLDYL
jgi:RNA polymerase sigma factor (sigma-70 family)|tara:strand:+ start:1627 stop:2391 length:765 start_codon:yes stop_codon:yes gene_type:complete